MNDNINTEGAAGVPPLATGSPLWAVSVVLIRHKSNGNLNIMNHLQRVRAPNRDEATGCAVRVSMAELPEHSVHCVTALEYQSLENTEVTNAGAKTENYQQHE